MMGVRLCCLATHTVYSREGVRTDIREVLILETTAVVVRAIFLIRISHCILFD